MIRITQALAVAAVALMTLPSIAAALGVSIVNSSLPSGSILLPGQTITFDLVVENSGNEGVQGLGVTVDGYDTPDLDSRHDGHLEFLNGTAVDSVFATFIPGPNILDNPLLRAPGTEPVENYFVSQFDPQAYTTSVWVGADTGLHNGSGADDIGLGGNPINTGDIHFQVTFVAVPNGATPIGSSFTMNFNADVIGAFGEVLSSTGDTFQLRVIPEPGTALLMGLGLAGLAARRR